MDRVGEIGDDVGPESTDDFEDGELEIEKEGDFEIAAAAVIVIGRHASYCSESAVGFSGATASSFTQENLLSVLFR